MSAAKLSSKNVHCVNQSENIHGTVTRSGMIGITYNKIHLVHVERAANDLIEEFSIGPRFTNRQLAQLFRVEALGTYYVSQF